MYVQLYYAQKEMKKISFCKDSKYKLKMSNLTEVDFNTKQCLHFQSILKVNYEVSGSSYYNDSVMFSILLG